MEKQNSVIEITHQLLNSLNFEHTDEIKSSLRGLGDSIKENLNESPLRTVGVAFCIGFAVTSILRTSRKELQMKLADAAGAALVYGLVNPILRAREENSKRVH